jgi:hypothetical protein
LFLPSYGENRCFAIFGLEAYRWGSRMRAPEYLNPQPRRHDDGDREAIRNRHCLEEWSGALGTIGVGNPVRTYCGERVVDDG